MDPFGLKTCAIGLPQSISIGSNTPSNEVYTKHNNSFSTLSLMLIGKGLDLKYFGTVSFFK